MTRDLDRIRDVDRWLATLRLLTVPLAALQVYTGYDEYPAGHGPAASIATAAFAAGAVALFAVTRGTHSSEWQSRIGLGALLLDTAFVFAFVVIFAFENGQPMWSLFFVPIIEGALRFGFAAGIAVPLASAPMLSAAEAFRAARFEPDDFRIVPVAIRVVLGLLLGAVVGRLVHDLVEHRATAEERAGEAERLRDELGRRVDLLEAANRCGRALASSLDLDEAFNAFIRELRGLIPFDRMAIVLAERGRAHVMATAGEAADSVVPPATTRDVTGSVLEQVLEGRVVYREDMADGDEHPEEAELAALGLHSRVAAPLLVGARAFGMLSLVRREPRSFTAEDVELLSLLGRLVGTAVQNIRAFEAERSTGDELRRLSALRADFVSLVSHELRSPMAAVIGAARTLEQRWRELGPGQRESLLALIADETSRLADLIGDVLDTSRIEAGTFSYVFTDVDVGELVREAVATAALGQDEVHVEAAVREPLPRLRGDRDRLRQILMNLIENAVKYSPTGAQVDVEAFVSDGSVSVEVTDRGPGVPADQQRVIFEKFGRAATSAGKPGTGLGLFIARSIAEAHGGTLEVTSQPGRGTTFTLTLPV